MDRLIITEFITLDGVVDSPGGGPHPHAGWTFRHVAFDEAAYEIKDREQQEATAMLMGRISYEEFAPRRCEPGRRAGVLERDAGSGTGWCSQMRLLKASALSVGPVTRTWSSS
ncbi:hypothetical protein [Kocuria sabuli]|uniref:hypothetical protein n=1 Tax=Kocuria sabuli TaxID=3071448 RepID=UPI0034D5EDCF